MRCLSLVCLWVGLVAPCICLADVPPPDTGPRVGRVLVVANAADPASMELARLYMDGRHLPAANLLRIPFDNPVNIDSENLQSRLLNPLQERLKRLPDSIDFVVFMRGVPYRLDGKISVPTAVMFWGKDSIRPVNPYYRQEIPFDSSLMTSGRPLFLPTFITGYTFEDTRRLIADSRVIYPSAEGAGTFYLCEGAGPRGVRRRQIDGALAALQQYQARGERVAGADVAGRLDILGQFTGAPRLKLEGNRYLPGSIVDNMTSWGGYLLDQQSQMSILSFIRHGTCGAYGTVSEPTNSLRRWADFSLPARYASGFNLAESYYQALADWRFGLLVGDPLMSPFSHPLAVEMYPETETVPAGAPGAVRVVLTEGAPGEGIGSADIWLNNQMKLLSWQPMLPVGTRCGLRILAGDAPLLEKEVSVAENAENLGAVLDAFTGDISATNKIARTGRRRDKLLFLLQPRFDESGQVVPLNWEFTMQIGDRVATSKGTVATQAVMAQAAVLDFGSEPPRPGDKVTVTIQGQSRSAQAFASTNQEELLTKLVEYMEHLPFLKPGGDYAVMLQKMPLNPPRFRILVFPKKSAANQEFPIAVSVNRVGGSTFALGLDAVETLWQKVPVGGVSQACFTPKVPLASASFTVEIPADALYPGPHAVLCVAATPAGTETIAEALLTALPEPGRECAARFSGETFNFRDKLMVYMNAGPGLEDAWPRLVVDDRVVCVWEPGTRVGEFVLDGSLVAPGGHVAWIEWAAAGGLPDPTRMRQTLARSSVSRVFVRRPLAAGVKLAPESVKAGTKTVSLAGPYLRENIRVMTGHKLLPMRRDARNPLNWNLDISGLSPGVYTLSLIGRAEYEQSGIISAPLVIQWRDEAPQ